MGTSKSIDKKFRDEIITDLNNAVLKLIEHEKQHGEHNLKYLAKLDNGRVVKVFVGRDPNPNKTQNFLSQEKVSEEIKNIQGRLL